MTALETSQNSEEMTRSSELTSPENELTFGESELRFAENQFTSHENEFTFREIHDVFDAIEGGFCSKSRVWRLNDLVFVVEMIKNRRSAAVPKPILAGFAAVESLFGTANLVLGCFAHV